MHLDLEDRDTGNKWQESSSCCMKLFTCAAQVLHRSDSYRPAVPGALVTKQETCGGDACVETGSTLVN